MSLLSRLPFSLDRSVGRTRTRKQSNRAIPTIDLLEDRQLLTPTAYTVTNLDDNGLGSLRYAITQANVQAPNPDGSLIQFAQGLSGQITLSSTLVLNETDGPEVISGPGASLLTVNGNNAVQVFEVNQRATLSGLAISGSRSHDYGGIRNAGTLNLANCTLSHNSATGGYGGGIYNDGGTLNMTNCTLSDNYGYYGGGINNNGTATLANCTLAGNSANTGGGIYNNSRLTLTNCTLANNSANAGGGILNRYTATLNNSIVANSLTGSDIVNQKVLSGSNNLVEDGSGLTGWLTGDPRLGELSYSGGPTQTIALLPGSPAIDAGSNAMALDASRNPLTTDQRGAGFARISGSRVDLGAFEFQFAAAPTITTLLASSGSLTYGQSEVLTATVTTNPPGATTPTGGAVTFMDGSTVLGSAPLSNGIATFSTTTLRVGTHALTATYSGDGVNFSASAMTMSPLSVQVFSATLTVTANNQARVYGAANAPLTYSISGFVNGDTATSLATLPTLATTANTSSQVGSYAITASGAVSSDYAIKYVTGTLLVAPAPLTITANNASMLQGAAVPPLSASYRGFVNGESSANLSTSPMLTTPATAVSPPGSYAILVEGASSPNYAINYANGILVVTPAPVVVGGASSPNYAIDYANGLLVVTPAPVRVLNVSTEAVRLGKAKKTTPVIVLQFTGSLNVGTAQSIGDYSLTTIPANKRQKSQAIALSQAQYNAATNTVTLLTRKPLVHKPSLKLTYNLLDAYNDSVSGNVTIGEKG
jgi:hypothetical protein